MKFPLFKIESEDLRSLVREFLLGVIILLALFTLNVFAGPITSPGKAGVFERFEKALASNVIEQLSTQMKVDAKEFSITFESLKVRPSLPQMENYNLQVMGLGSIGSRRSDGLVSLSVLIEGIDGQQKPTEVIVTGVMKVVGPVVISQRTIQKGEALSESSVSYKKMMWSSLPTSTLAVNISSLLGKSARVQLIPGQAIAPEMVEEPAFVNNGDAIDLTVFSGPGVIIRSRGVARQSGKMGEPVKVEFPETKKTLTGMVAGKKSVEVRL